MPDSNLNTADLDDAPCGFLVFSDDGTITSINQTLVSLLHYEDKKELLGKSIETIFTIAGRIFYQTHFFPLIRLQGNADEIFFTLKGKQPEGVPVICNARRKPHGNGYSNHCIFMPAHQRGKYEQQLLLTKRDAQKALEENRGLTEARLLLEENTIALDRQLSRLLQVNNELVQFSKVVSHDLQEPIRKMALLADKVAVENGAVLDAAGLAMLQKISRESHRARRLGAVMEEFISLNLGTGTMQQVNLIALVAEECSRDGIDTIHFVPQLAQLNIAAYKNQLRMLLGHIIGNSLQYRDENRPLQVEVQVVLTKRNSYKELKEKYRYRDYAEITITDNGKGFDTTTSDIFRIARKTNEASGLSFGLAFCKKITDNHNGFISATSQPGQGTTITILLPVNQE